MFKTLCLIAMLSAGAASANSVTYDPGTSSTVTPAMEAFATTGPQMAGMQVTVVQGGVSTNHT